MAGAGLLHTIIFNRALGRVQPKEIESELIDITYVRFDCSLHPCDIFFWCFFGPPSPVAEGAASFDNRCRAETLPLSRKLRTKLANSRLGWKNIQATAVRWDFRSQQSALSQVLQTSSS